jgi:nucleoporin NUP82
MVLKDADLIVAVGKELRVTSLGDAKLGRAKSKSYKVPISHSSAISSNVDLLLQVLHTPNIQFDISYLSLNPTRKLLVVAGTSQVAVVVLPRPGFMRLVPTVIDCKYAPSPAPRTLLFLTPP